MLRASTFSPLSAVVVSLSFCSTGLDGNHAYCVGLESSIFLPSGSRRFVLRYSCRVSVHDFKYHQCHDVGVETFKGHMRGKADTRAHLPPERH